MNATRIEVFQDINEEMQPSTSSNTIETDAQQVSIIFFFFTTFLNNYLMYLSFLPLQRYSYRIWESF